ncbi:MAG TPA: glutamine--fructose-6-phosphate transaminase (isomerizing) [Candidatus Saccharibacteria bacterium]|nr:glutamine--fructose-6-phosphate transaminase (isomerizing) [Candidatus Saccharibacteria bacterium]
MCGIVGYIGKNNSIEPVLNGLKNLEYRGYDSAGIAFASDNSVKCIKQTGRVSNLGNAINKQVKTKMAIGHTRWATHGPPTILNAHPHYNPDKTIFVAHNGIIENYEDIQKFLCDRGYNQITQTDSELIPLLIDYHYKKDNNLEKAFRNTVRELEGAFAIAMISTLDKTNMYVAKMSSPLLIGIGKSSNMVGSDVSAVCDYAKKIIHLEDYEMAKVGFKKYKITNFKNNNCVDRTPENINLETIKADLKGYKHYMLKEIFEAPQTIQSAMLGRVKTESNSIKLGGLELVENQLQSIERILIVACGTSYYAGLIGEYLIEEIANIPVEVQQASEFKYKNEPIFKNTVVLAISQSGETADTIAALKKVEDSGVLRLGIVNSPGSTIARITDAGVYCHAGPEISVASTKAFIAQVTVLSEIALMLGKGKIPNYKQLIKEIVLLPKKTQVTLKQADRIESIAKKYYKYKDFLFIGRGYEYPVALEGALKLKEISYIHAEGYAAGEMKHGPLAMIDPKFPTFALASSSNLIEKTTSNLQEIKARKGKIIVVVTKKTKAKVKSLVDEIIEIPETLDQYLPILEAIVVQLFAYYVALNKNLDIDKPRNLAKSVTVE